ncbi:MAG: hypothetical protein JXQ83_03535 [Candidatus Glassbacteria bacterium]|nr:hypothetical protein [Candidatus Glassbacteria bacterium]
MSENRSQDIQLIKIAIQIEKDGEHFLERFQTRLGESSSLKSFVQQMLDEAAADREAFENLLVPLESVQNTDKIEDISLDDYVKDLQKTRSEKFYPHTKAEELFDRNFNPIHVLAYCVDTWNELSNFYSISSGDIFYENEKKAFEEISSRKKEQAEQIAKKKKEVIARFP